MPPFQGGNRVGVGFPGRSPGLSHSAPSGPAVERVLYLLPLRESGNDGVEESLRVGAIGQRGCFPSTTIPRCVSRTAPLWPPISVYERIQKRISVRRTEVELAYPFLAEAGWVEGIVSGGLFQKLLNQSGQGRFPQTGDRPGLAQQAWIEGDGHSRLHIPNYSAKL